MPKARAFDDEEVTKPIAPGELCFFALPVETFRALSDAAAVQGLTLAQLFKRAVDGVLVKPEGVQATNHRLLTERR